MYSLKQFENCIDYKNKSHILKMWLLEFSSEDSMELRYILFKNVSLLSA